MSSPAIVCDALSRDFGAVRALDRLSLEVPSGSIFAFLGPNGAGKTTTIHLLLGIIEPASGSSRVLDLDPVRHGDEVRRRCGALLEHSGLYERLSAQHNLRFYARIAHLGADEAEARIEELLPRFGLWERRADPIGTFSRGMKQKLAIARVLLHRPSLIFLDEPTAGLDPEATVALRRDIVSLGTTVFLTTHNLADVEKMATHVAVIQSGRLLDIGTPAELRARAIRSHITIRMTGHEPLALDLQPGESVAPIVSGLVHEGAQIEEVRREEPSIEDVFLHLVKEGGRPGRLPASVPLGGEDRDAGRVAMAGGTPAFPDIAAVVRKEWREFTTEGTRSTRYVNRIAVSIMLAIVAGLAALGGEKLIHSPAALGATMIAAMILLSTIPDSFAGERERHTLETLLASAIPDEALLIGKIAASVLYGWGAALVIVGLLLAGANFTAFPVMYRPSIVLAMLVLTPLALTFFATAGVLISLHAPTVREAQLRLSTLLFGLMIPPVAARPFLSEAVRQRAATMLYTEAGRLQSIAAQCLILVVIDIVLIALAMARFRRSRLL